MSMKDSRGNSGLMFLMFPRNGRPGGEGISTVPSMFVLVVSLMVVDVMRESRPEPVLTRVKRKGYDLEDVGDVADLETQRRRVWDSETHGDLPYICGVRVATLHVCGYLGSAFGMSCRTTAKVRKRVVALL